MKHRVVRGADLPDATAETYREYDWLFDPERDDYVAIRKGVLMTVTVGQPVNPTDDERADATLARARTMPNDLDAWDVVEHAHPPEPGFLLDSHMTMKPGTYVKRRSAKDLGLVTD